MTKFKRVNGIDSAPQNFHAAVESIHSAELRSEIALGTVRPPQKLAPFSHAVSPGVTQSEADIVPESSGDDAFDRLTLLHDPRSEETWDDDMRLVAYIQTDMDTSLMEDPLLLQVAWQWLIEALAENDAELPSLGGTVTITNSVCYGRIGGEPQTFQLEMHASWTARGTDLRAHVESFAQVLVNIAGLSFVGASLLN